MGPLIRSPTFLPQTGTSVALNTLYDAAVEHLFGQEETSVERARKRAWYVDKRGVVPRAHDLKVEGTEEDVKFCLFFYWLM